jgi:hypothetical protein
MCTGFEPLLFEAGAGELFLGDMLATGAGGGLTAGGVGTALSAAGAAGAADSFLGDMAATGAGEGVTAGGLGSEAMGAMGASGGGAANYLESLGGLDSLAGSQFAESMAPFTSGATNVASITGNAVPGLENNIGSFEGISPGGDITPQALPDYLGSSGASNFNNVTSRGISLQNPNLAGQDYINGNAFSGGGLSSMANAPANGGLGMQGTMGAGTSLGYGSEGLGLGAPSEGMFAGAGPTAASTSPFSLQNMMNNPMGMVKSAYDKVSNNPIPSMYAAGSLYDMYAKNKMAEAQKGMYNQNRADIMNTYAPGSPEYNLLQQQIARKDAAAGRNSQYGTRANELAGTIAKLRMGALGTLQQGQNSLGNQALGNQYGMFNTPLALAMYSQKPNAAATASY